MELLIDSRKQQVEELSKEFETISDITTLKVAVVDAAIRITRAEEATIFFLNEGSGELYRVADKYLRERLFHEVRVKIVESRIASVITERHPRRLTGEQLNGAMGDTVKGLMATPLVARGHIFGILCVFNKEDGSDFSDEDEEVFELLANQAAVPLDHTITLNETERRAETITGLRTVSESLLTVRDLTQLLEMIAQKALQVLDADVVVLFEYFKEKKDVLIPPIFVGRVNDPNILEKEGSLSPHDDSVLYKIIEQPEPFYAPIAREDWVEAGYISPGWSKEPKGFLNREKIVSSAGIPLVSTGEPVGVLFINYRKFRPFTPEQRERTEAFANLAALAIHNARVFAQRERSVDELSVLNEIGKAISSATTLGVDHILDLVYQQTKRLMDVTSFYVAFFDEPTDTVSFKFAVEEGQSVALGVGDWVSRKAGNGLTEYVIHQAEPLLIRHGLGTWLEEQDVDCIGPLAKSWLGVPMFTEERVLGVIGIQNYQKEYVYGSRDRDILASIAAQAAIAIEQTRLFRDVRSQKDELEALHNTAATIGSEADIQSRLDALVTAAKTRFSVNGGCIYLDDPDKQVLVLRALQGVPPKRYKLGSTLPHGQGLSGLIIQERKTHFVNDYAHYENRIPHLADVFGNVIAAPLMLQDEVIGVLAVFDPEGKRTFSGEDSPGLERFARHTALVIRDARLLREKDELLRETEDRMRNLAAVDTVAQLIGKKLNKESVLKEVTRRIKEELKCGQCTLFFPEEIDGETWLVQRVRDASDNGEASVGDIRFQPGTGLVGRVYNRGHAEVFPDAPAHEDFLQEPPLPPYRYRSMLVVPIKSGSKIISLICADDEEPGHFTARDKDLVESLALHAAIAIDRANALEVQQQLSRKLLHPALATEMEGLLKQIIESARTLTGATSGVIYLINEGKNDVTYTYYPEDYKEHHPSPRRGVEGKFVGLTGDIIRERRLEIIGDVKKDPRVTREVYDQITTLVGVPLMVDEEVIGVMYLDHEEYHEYSEIETSILFTLINQAALALNNFLLMHRIQRVRNAARVIAGTTVIEDLQKTLRSILEVAKDVLGCDVAAIYSYNQEHKTFHSLQTKIGVTKKRKGALSRKSALFRVLNYGQLYQAIDVENDPILGGPFVEREGIKSAVGIPLIVTDPGRRERKVGAMFVNYRTRHHFTSDELADIELFASLAATAIWSAQLFKDLELELDKSFSLHKAGRAVLGEVLDLEKTLEELARAAFSLVKQRGGLYSVLAMVQDGVLHFKAASPKIMYNRLLKNPGQINTRGRRGRKGIMGRAFKKGKTQRVGDIRQDRDYINFNEETRSELVVPIKRGNKVIGTLSVGSKRLNAFSKKDEKVFETLAGYAGIAIQNVNQVKQLKEVVNRLTEMRNATRRFASLTVEQGDLENTLQEITDGIMETLRCDVVTLHPYDQNRRSFPTPPAMSGVRDQITVYEMGELDDESAVYQILRHEEPYYLAPDVSNEPEPKVGGPFARREKIKSTVGLRLTFKQRKVGVLFVSYRSRYKFTTEELENIQLFADQAAMTIQNAQVRYALKQQRSKWASALYQAGKAVTGTAHALDETLELLVQYAYKLMEADGKEGAHSYIRLLSEKDTLDFKTVHPRLSRAILRARNDKLKTSVSGITRIGITGRVLLTGESINEGDVSRNEDYVEFDEQTRSELAVPISVEDTVIGVLSIEHPEHNAFTLDNEQALIALAEYAAVAIENTRLIQRLAEAEEEIIMTASESFDDTAGVFAGQFYYGRVVHDLRHVLGQIEFRIQELKSEPYFKKLSVRKRRAVDKTIERINESYASMTEYLEDVASLEHEMGRFDINRIIGQATRLLNPKIEEANVKLDISQLREKLPKVYVNRVQMVLIMFNLIGNAIDALLKVDRPRELGIETRSEGDRFVEVIVRDNGCGIHPSDKDRIFLPRFSTKGKSGKGLGLFAAKRILSKQKGEISFRSNYGKGTTFRVKIPRG